jgi:nicotinamide riboside transporter PnuC
MIFAVSFEIIIQLAVSNKAYYLIKITYNYSIVHYLGIFCIVFLMTSNVQQFFLNIIHRFMYFYF